MRRRLSTDSVQCPVEQRGGGEKPGTTPVVEPRRVPHLGEHARPLLAEEHPGELMTHESGESDAVTGIAEGVPDAIDLTHVGEQIEGNRALPAPDMRDPGIFELGEEDEKLSTEVGTGLAQIETGMQVAAPPDEDAIVRGPSHGVEKPLLVI